MGWGEFASQCRGALSNYGLLTGSRLIVQKAVERVLSRVGRHLNYGLRPLDTEWDVLIVLDACRADLFEEFAPQHSVFEQFHDISSRHSCASTSREWFAKGFGSADDDEVATVHYVSENPYVTNLDLDRFYDVERLWEAVPDSDTGVVQPSVVTAGALNAYDKSEADRFVVHYMPPHAPFLHCPRKYDLDNKAWGGDSHDTWFGLNEGRFDLEEVWEDYGQNLLAVLDEVEKLITHVDGKVIVTADHGNAVGEFGVYGHPEYVPLPSLKRVPWVEAEGQGVAYDTTKFDTPNVNSDPDDAVTEKLEALGYI